MVLSTEVKNDFLKYIEGCADEYNGAFYLDPLGLIEWLEARLKFEERQRFTHNPESC